MFCVGEPFTHGFFPSCKPICVYATLDDSKYIKFFSLIEMFYFLKNHK